MKHSNHLLLGSLLLVLADDSFAADLEDRWKQACENVTYTSSLSIELTRAEELFLGTLDMTELTVENGFESLRQGWAELGLELLLIESGGELLLVLEEAPLARRGRGFFVFRLASRRALAIQAPHAVRDDLDTAEIAFALFRHSGAAFSAWSTARRRDVNLSGETGTFFQLFTELYARREPRATILQLHGYSRRKRSTPEGRKAHAIVSSGTSRPPSAVSNFAACLARELSIRAPVYPSGVRELGATTNVQAAALTQLEHPGFVHFEMSRGLRRRLVASVADRAGVLTCLDTTFELPETR